MVTDDLKERSYFKDCFVRGILLSCLVFPAAPRRYSIERENGGMLLINFSFCWRLIKIVANAVNVV